MATLVIVIPFFERHELTRAVFRHYRRIQEKWTRDRIEILAVGSEGGKSEKLAFDGGFDYIETPNWPLPAKYDAGIHAARHYSPDAVSLVGSNDMLSGRYFSAALSAIGDGRADSTGLLDCNLVDLSTRRLAHWPGYSSNSIGQYGDEDRSREGESIAAGRVYSRKLLDKTGWSLFLPDKSVSSSMVKMDDDEANIDCLNHHEAIIKNWRMADLRCQFWNLKSESDINPYSAFEAAYVDGIQPVDDPGPEFWSQFNGIWWFRSFA